MLRLQRRHQRVDIHDRTPSGIDQMGTRLHPRQLFGADHPKSPRRFRNMQGHHVGEVQEGVQRWQCLNIAQRQLGLDVVKHHPHPQRLGQQSDLGTDVAVADDTQAFTAHLVGTGGGLDPAAAMDRGITLGNTAHQQHDFG